MPIKTYRPTTQTLRYRTTIVNDDITTKHPHKPLLEPKPRTGGRRNSGRFGVGGAADRNHCNQPRPNCNQAAVQGHRNHCNHRGSYRAAVAWWWWRPCDRPNRNHGRGHQHRVAVDHDPHLFEPVHHCRPPGTGYAASRAMVRSVNRLGDKSTPEARSRSSSRGTFPVA